MNTRRNSAVNTTIQRDDEERQSVIRRAKASTVLNAAFYVIYYNRERRHYGAAPKSLEISMSEVFDGRESDTDVLNALEKARALLGDCYKLTDALYQGDAKRFEKLASDLKSTNPGFSDDCYGMVWHLAQRNAR
jgi:hypothetical protein